MQVDGAFQLIRHAFLAQRLAHGYLITGPTRGAAGALAVRVLQMLFCTAETAPCGTCDRCRQVFEHTWADAFWLNPEKKSRIISAEQMRGDLLLELTQTSLAGGWKAGVIVGADRLSEAAANILLKTLEEPPPQTVFLLLTDSPQALLPTILSRCQRIAVDDDAPLAEPWRGRLLSLLAAPQATGPLQALVLAGGLTTLLGNMKDAAEADVQRERQAEREMLDEDQDVFLARVSARYREYRTGLLRTMLDWHRDLLVLRAGGSAALLRHPDQAEVLHARAQSLTLAQALANVQGMDVVDRQLERNLPEGSVLAYWMDRFSAASGVAAAAGQKAGRV